MTATNAGRLALPQVLRRPGLDVQVGIEVARHRIVLPSEVDEHLPVTLHVEHPGPSEAFAADGRALVGLGGQRDTPALTELAEATVIVNPDLVEEHFVEGRARVI